MLTYYPTTLNCNHNCSSLSVVPTMSQLWPRRCSHQVMRRLHWRQNKSAVLRPCLQQGWAVKEPFQTRFQTMVCAGQRCAPLWKGVWVGQRHTSPHFQPYPKSWDAEASCRTRHANGPLPSRLNPAHRLASLLRVSGIVASRLRAVLSSEADSAEGQGCRNAGRFRAVGFGIQVEGFRPTPCCRSSSSSPSSSGSKLVPRTAACPAAGSWLASCRVHRKGPAWTLGLVALVKSAGLAAGACPRLWLQSGVGLQQLELVW